MGAPACAYTESRARGLVVHANRAGNDGLSLVDAITGGTPSQRQPKQAGVRDADPRRPGL